MLKNNKAFASFAAKDLQAAKQFYTEVLGREVEETKGMPIMRLRLSEDSYILIYEKPDHQPAVFTVLNFEVEDVEKTVDELTAKGVKFEQYTGDIQTDEKGIFRGHGVVNAWFKDPSGNILAILSMEKK